MHVQQTFVADVTKEDMMLFYLIKNNVFYVPSPMLSARRDKEDLQTLRDGNENLLIKWQTIGYFWNLILY